MPPGFPISAVEEKQLNCPFTGSHMRTRNRETRGLSYLHCAFRPPIIHYNVKPSNILLNAGGEAKVADFGLIRLLGPRPERQGTRQSAFGYAAPELEGFPLWPNGWGSNVTAGICMAAGQSCRQFPAIFPTKCPAENDIFHVVSDFCLSSDFRWTSIRLQTFVHRQTSTQSRTYVHRQIPIRHQTSARHWNSIGLLPDAEFLPVAKYSLDFYPTLGFSLMPSF
ncbi:mitogen-activated protein kinase kinase 5-like [Dendrobium catenatum]|uniref:mitogen-activated protein kinase kinase 5-like n=1 Tax=Dendrobium catenatum TaxID=906689 RepID=UPI0009F1B5ED|nr:mitogen-activated protein kinase kinase 5-like [Dendrobium catenatum]